MRQQCAGTAGLHEPSSQHAGLHTVTSKSPSQQKHTDNWSSDLLIWESRLGFWPGPERQCPSTLPERRASRQSMVCRKIMSSTAASLGGTPWQVDGTGCPCPLPGRGQTWAQCEQRGARAQACREGPRRRMVRSSQAHPSTQSSAGPRAACPLYAQHLCK